MMIIFGASFPSTKLIIYQISLLFSISICVFVQIIMMSLSKKSSHILSYRKCHEYTVIQTFLYNRLTFVILSTKENKYFLN